MNARLLDHLYIATTIVLTVYSQMTMRWQVAAAGSLPADMNGKAFFIGQLLLNPWVLSGILATFISGISWMLAMSKFDVSYAYPFVSLNYVLVLVASALLFSEPIGPLKLAGTALIILGVIVIAQG